MSIVGKRIHIVETDHYGRPEGQVGQGVVEQVNEGMFTHVYLESNEIGNCTHFIGTGPPLSLHSRLQITVLND